MNLVDHIKSRPVIEKLGTIRVDVVETTPFVFGDAFYRLEWARNQPKPNSRNINHLRIVESDTGRTISEFGDGFCFPSALVDGDTVYVSGSSVDQTRIQIFSSRNMTTWETRPTMELGRYRVCNTSLCKTDDGYAMSFEIDSPPEEVGVPYTARFALSHDLRTWTITPPDCVYSRDRYTAPHMLRYHDGQFYLFYLEEFRDPPHGNKFGCRYEQYVVRSKDLVRWESSPLNPVLAASIEDRRIADPQLGPGQIDEINRALDCNNSDIDVCEYRGQVVIFYSWGDQTGAEFLAQAVYHGTLTQFLTSWFPGQAIKG